DDEREADRIGFQLMIDAGYDPRSMIAMFERLQQRYKTDPGSLEKLFITHPPTDERIANLKAQLLETRPSEDLLLTTPQFQEIKRRVTERYPAPPPPKKKDHTDKDKKDK
ncbi:MAG: M48 family metalloprotease, partial [Acidobacteria bacterium]|nr:M48 family metalloprotease [Acidobacteriota bacterium]